MSYPGLGPLPLGVRARLQLAAWQEIAATWPYVIRVEDDGQQVMACGECGAGMWLVTDPGGVAYTWEPGQVLAMIVLHLRTRHADLDPDR